MRSAGMYVTNQNEVLQRGTWNIQVINTMLPVTSIWPRIMLCRKSSASIRGRYLTKNGSRRKNAGIAVIHNRWFLRFKSVCQKLTAHRACNMPPNTAVSFLICFWKILYIEKGYWLWRKTKTSEQRPHRRRTLLVRQKSSSSAPLEREICWNCMPNM